MCNGWMKYFGGRFDVFFICSGNFSLLLMIGREKCITFGQENPKFWVQEEGQFVRTEDSASRPIYSRKTVLFLIYGYFRVIGVNGSAFDCAYLFLVVLRNVHIQEFDTRWDDFSLWKILIRIRVFEFTTVWELYDLSKLTRKSRNLMITDLRQWSREVLSKICRRV